MNILKKHLIVYFKWINYLVCKLYVKTVKTDNKNFLIKKKHHCGGGMNWEIGIDIYTLLILCIK